MAMESIIKRAAGVQSVKDRGNFATKDNILEASKAVHDSIKTLLDSKMTQMGYDVKSMVDVQLRQMEHAVKNVEANILMTLGRSVDEYARKNLEGYLQKQLSDIRSSFDVQVKSIEARYEEKLAFIQQAHNDTMGRLEMLISRLTLPAPVVEVMTPTPIVNVEVPEQKTPVVNVMAAEQPAPIVNVMASETQPVFNIQVPEQAAPVVNVEQPKRGKIVKDISYDDFGRPVHVEEREEKE